MKTIELTKGLVALVDDDDFEELNKYSWHASFPRANNATYAIRHVGGSGRARISMHRQLLGLTDPKILCDHIDHNGLNNQRNNIRVVSPSQNQANRSKIRGSSKYKGVHFYKKGNTWMATIRKNGDLIQLGSYSLEDDAARAYNIAAKELYGDYAHLNIVDMSITPVRNKRGGWHQKRKLLLSTNNETK